MMDNEVRRRRLLNDPYYARARALSVYGTVPSGQDPLKERTTPIPPVPVQKDLPPGAAKPEPKDVPNFPVNMEMFAMPITDMREVGARIQASNAAMGMLVERSYPMDPQRVRLREMFLRDFMASSVVIEDEYVGHIRPRDNVIVLDRSHSFEWVQP